MCQPNLSSKPLPEGVAAEKVDDDKLWSLLIHAETLQHSRIYFFLVAETVFFLAAATVWSEPLLILSLAAPGVATALMFTMINLKHHWRVLWLSRKLESASPLFRRYVNFHSFDNLVMLRGVTDLLRRRAIRDETLLPVAGPEENSGRCKCLESPWWANTGFLFTWVLLFIVMVPWVLFTGYALFKLSGAAITYR